MSIGLDGPPASLANKVAAGAAGLVLPSSSEPAPASLLGGGAAPSAKATAALSLGR